LGGKFIALSVFKIKTQISLKARLVVEAYTEKWNAECEELRWGGVVAGLRLLRGGDGGVGMPALWAEHWKKNIRALAQERWIRRTTLKNVA